MIVNDLNLVIETLIEFKEQTDAGNANIDGCPFSLMENFTKSGYVGPFWKCSICRFLFPEIRTNDIYATEGCPCQKLGCDYVRNIVYEFLYDIDILHQYQIACSDNVEHTKIGCPS